MDHTHISECRGESGVVGYQARFWKLSQNSGLFVSARRDSFEERSLHGVDTSTAERIAIRQCRAGRILRKVLVRNTWCLMNIRVVDQLPQHKISHISP